MKKLSVLLGVVFAFFFFFSCTHDPLLPQEQVSFHNDILPIVRGSCQHSGCHDPFDPDSEFPLDSVRSDYDAYVDPGKPKHSKLYEAIKGSNGEERMPQAPYDPLTDRQKKLIYIWIGQGAKDN
jgi:hypothetical protein